MSKREEEEEQEEGEREGVLRGKVGGGGGEEGGERKRVCEREACGDLEGYLGEALRVGGP